MTTSLSSSSIRLHKIIEYVKELGLPLETDEVEDLSTEEILYSIYGISHILTSQERSVLRDTFLAMAEANEVREARMKLSEALPEDHGVVLLRQTTSWQQGRATSYPVHFSYPVDANLRRIGRTGGASFSITEKKPFDEGAMEVEEDE